MLQFVCECDVVKDTGKEEYLRPFIHIGLDYWQCYITSMIPVHITLFRPYLKAKAATNSPKVVWTFERQTNWSGTFSCPKRVRQRKTPKDRQKSFLASFVSER